MDVRLTSEQQQLREAAAKLADDLGPGSVADLEDRARIARLEKADLIAVDIWMFGCLSRQWLEEVG